MTGTWRPLKVGDTIDLVAPGSASLPETVEKAFDFIKSWGLVPRIDKEAFAWSPFHANEDEVRLKLFLKALKAKDSKMIWCLRGGYGGLRLIPDLLKQKAAAGMPCKPVLGYSDISSLHLWLDQKWKWSSLHGPLLDPVISNKYSEDQVKELKEVLFGKKREVSYDLSPINSLAEKKKKIQGITAGGNLTVLASHLGTPLSFKAKGRILVFEEVGERGYRVDRMLEQMRQAQVFKDCVAIVFGDFIKGDEGDGKNFVEFAIKRFAKEIKVPCFSGMPIGHGEQNRILPLRQKATLIKNRLSVATGAIT